MRSRPQQSAIRNPQSAIALRWRALLGTATVLLLAATAQAQGPNPGNVGQGVAAVLIFLLLLGMLGKWAWKPLIAQLRGREEAIAATIKRSEEKEREAEDLATHYRSRLARADEEAREVVDRARDAAESQREEILASAKQEARQTVHATQREIDRSKRDALRDLYHTTADLATEVAQRVLRRSLSPDEQRRLLAESLEEIRLQVAAQHAPAAEALDAAPAAEREG